MRLTEISQNFLFENDSITWMHLHCTRVHYVLELIINSSCHSRVIKPFAMCTFCSDHFDKYGPCLIKFR